MRTLKLFVELAGLVKTMWGFIVDGIREFKTKKAIDKAKESGDTSDVESLLRK